MRTSTAPRADLTWGDLTAVAALALLASIVEAGAMPLRALCLALDLLLPRFQPGPIGPLVRDAARPLLFAVIRLRSRPDPMTESARLLLGLGVFLAGVVSSNSVPSREGRTGAVHEVEGIQPGCRSEAATKFAETLG